MELITSEKISGKVKDMNEIDMDLKGRHCIENICHDIYNDYIIYQTKLEKIKYELLSQIEKILGIHLQTSTSM